MRKAQTYFTRILRVFTISLLSLPVIFFVLTPLADAAAGILKQINFQGKVVNLNGTNVTNGDYSFLFCLYTVASPGTACTAGANNDAVWRESKTITVTDGVFQTLLGDTTALPGSVDFNSDNIYLGVNFNSDGQMTPLVRFSAVPYAFNADKIHGLSVTDTTGTFTLTNGKTLSVSNSLTFAGTDSTTITFQGTDTYVGRTTSDTLTNKTIGSTGLIFSGATTDITTASNEDLTLAVNGSGNFVFSTDFDSGITLGTAISNEFPLLVRSGIGNNVALAVDNLNLGDIFTASASGTTRFSITSAGGIKLGTAEGTNGDCLKSGGAGAAAAYGSCGGGSQTPWTADIDADGFDLNDLSNILFRETTGAPAGTDVYIFRDNTGDLNLNALTGRSVNLQVNGSDEYNFSSTAITVGANNIDLSSGNLAFSTTGGITFTGGTLSDATDGVDVNDDLDVSGILAIAGGDGSSFAGGITFNDDVLLTLGVTEAFTVNNTTQGASDLVSLNSTWTGANAADALAVTTIYNLSTNTGLQYGLNVTNADNTSNTGVIDALALFSNDQATETLADGIILRHNASSGTLTDALQIENTTAGGTITNAINILETAGTITTGINIGTVGTAIAVGTVTTVLDSANLDISNSGAITGATGITLASGDISLTAGNIVTDTTTGTKFGTATSQKIGFYNATPVVQPSGNALTALSNLGLISSPTLTSSNVGLGSVENTALSTWAGTTNLTTLGAATATSIALGTTPAAAGTLRLPNATYITARNAANSADINLIRVDSSNLVSFGANTAAFTLGGAITANSQNITGLGGLTVNGGGTINSASSGTLGVATTTNTTGLTIGNSGATSGLTFNIDTAANYVYQKEGSAYACSGTDKLTLNGSGQLVCGTDQTGGGGGSSNWTLDTANGVLRPNNNTTDVLFGGTSTSAASVKIGRAGSRTNNSSASDLEPLLTVGNSTTRGDLDVYGDVTKEAITKQTGLANINDIVVYDTTTDSNQGAWRKSFTSQQLSWYTEAKDDEPGDTCSVSSDDRCGDSDFPRKAILVTTNDALYIFNQRDGTMWMKFTQSGGTYALGADANNNPSGIVAINGVIYVGTNGSSATGIYVFDFVTDRTYLINTTNRSQGNKNIANRNTAISYATDANTRFAIVDNVVNDLSGTIVQGSASTNPMNGIILIAAATDTGVSVINLNRPSVFDYSDTTNDDYNAVEITKRGYVYALNETQQQLERWINVDSDSADELNGVPDRVWDQTGGVDAGTARTHGTALVGLNAAPTIQVSADDIAVTERSSASDEASDTIYVGTDKGLSVINSNITNESNGWSKYYTKDYVTDQMYGGVKAMLPFHNTSGDITDVSYKANVFDAKGTPAYANTDGVRGTSMLFDNSNDMLCSDSNNDATCDQDTDFDMGAAGANTGWYVSVWFKHSSTPPASDVDTLFSHGEDIVGTFVRDSIGWAMWMNTSGNILAGWDDDTTQTGNLPTDIQINSGGNYADNQWHQAMMVQVSATDRRLFIDGKQVGSSATSNTVSYTVTDLVLSVGGECSNVACTTGTRFWDGKIDDFVVGSDNGMLAASTYLSTAGNVTKLARRMFLEGNAALQRKTIAVTDATNGAGELTSTSIGDSGESWIPNEFVGSIVEITGGTGVGQTRRIVANTATVMTVWPAWTTTPDTTSDFAVKPEQIYGSTDTVKAVGLQDTFIGEHRKLYVGTNDGSDGGGVTVLNNVGANFVTDVYHSNANKTDDSASEWSGTDADDIQALADTNGVIVMGSLAKLWTEKESVSLGQVDDQLSTYVGQIRLELRNDGLGALTPEQGYVPGADLAENYISDEPLDKGEIVSVHGNRVNGIKKSQKPYDQNLIGVVASDPGIVLGPHEEGSYPIALVGRVPVKVSLENGLIKTGDRLTSSSVPGFAMKATKAGRVIGVALEDLNLDSLYDCNETGMLCGNLMVFVNLSDFQGQSVEVVMKDTSDRTLEDSGLSITDGVVSKNLRFDLPNQAKTLSFLQYLKNNSNSSSEIFTDRLSAVFEIIAPTVITDTLYAKKIKADSIEGLDILVASLKFKEERETSSKSAVLTESVSFEDKIASITKQFEDRFATQSAISSQLLTSNSDGLSTTSGSLRIKGNSLVEGILTVIESLTTNNFIVNGISTFFGETIFKDKVIFEKEVTFSSDSGGSALIKKDEKKVEIVFDKEFEEAPVVNVSVSFDEDKNEDGSIKSSDELEAKFFEKGYSYITVNKSKKGFVIVLNKKAEDNISFSWTVLKIKDAKTIQSKALE